MPMTEPALHPRPQLVRDGWVDLCGDWQFSFDSEVYDRTIRVPYPPESKLSGVGDTSFHPTVWYRREFAAPDLAAGERLTLRFGAVDYRASVWLNGQFLGDHVGGQAPFSFDVTDALAGDGPQTLTVRAEDDPVDASQPRGKQAWRTEPHGIFYHRTTGIWQPVWLERTPAVHIAELHWTPDLALARVTAEVRLNQAPRTPIAVDVRLRLGEEELARQRAQVAGSSCRIEIDVPALGHGVDRYRLLWSPESPTLVDAEVALLDQDDRGLDAVASYLGLRSVGWRDGRFLLNELPYFLRLVLEQGYWPESHLAAPSEDALRREAELVKSLGFNGVRVHQKVEDPRFLYWCDRLGLVVWGEMANAFEFSGRAMERLLREWPEVIRRDRSHPCVVTWVPLNESWGVPDIAARPEQRHYADALYHLTKALDPSRPVISNDGWEIADSDIVGVHDYAPLGQSLAERWQDADGVRRMLRGTGPGRRRVLLGDADDPRRRQGQPVVVSEFGGLSYAPEAGEKWFGYGTVASPEELLDRFGELVGALLDSTELAGFCYTQLTDTLQERNGLLDEHRNPKLPPDAVREIVARPSRAIPAELVDASRRAAQRRSRNHVAERRGVEPPVGPVGEEASVSQPRR